MPEEHLKVANTEKPSSLEDTKFLEVHTEEQLNMMVSEIKNVRELAIDLEVK